MSAAPEEPLDAARDDFLAQIGTYRAKDLLENQGTKIWTGSLDVTPRRSLARGGGTL